MTDRRCVPAACLAIFIVLKIPFLFSADWRPVDAAELAQKAPQVQINADAEGMFWDVQIGRGVSHYIRMKIFTEKGREKWSTLTIPYAEIIGDVQGRVIKPDGSIMELSKDAVEDGQLFLLDTLGSKTIILRIPALEAGDIIDYQWTENSQRGFYKYYLQRDIPFKTVSYHWNNAPSTLTTLTFNYPPVKWKKEAKNRFGFQIHNVPGLEYEAQMPPQDSARAYFLVSRANLLAAPDKYWPARGKVQYVSSKGDLKPNGKIKKTVAQIIGASSDPEEVISKLFNFVRLNVKDVEDPEAVITAKERVLHSEYTSSVIGKAMRDGLSVVGDPEFASHALNKGIASCWDMNILFGSMAVAAGFDARSVSIFGRSQIFFTPSLTDDLLFARSAMVIKTGGTWKFYDHCSRYLPGGMLPWWMEGSPAFIPDDKNPVFAATPLSAPEASQAKRTAILQLSEDGTLEGDVTVMFSGHMDNYIKTENVALLSSERRKNPINEESESFSGNIELLAQHVNEKKLRSLAKAQFALGEVSDIQIKNNFSKDKSFIYRYHIKVPGYALKNGNRLSLRPVFFQYGQPPLFTAEERKQDIYFRYPWSELDAVEIRFPPGYALEPVVAKQPVALGKVGRYEIRLSMSKDSGSIYYTRKFSMGGEARILFSARDYAVLKRFFDSVYEGDGTAIALRAPAAQ